MSLSNNDDLMLFVRLMCSLVQASEDPDDNLTL